MAAWRSRAIGIHPLCQLRDDITTTLEDVNTAGVSRPARGGAARNKRSANALSRFAYRAKGSVRSGDHCGSKHD
jgi:hypothetical protein